jgi:predicted O-methyltransferase YrrM
MENEMTYPNWFESTDSIHNFQAYIPRGDNLRYLQVGAYTGDATEWMVKNALGDGSVLIDVDTWEGSDEPVHKNMDWSDVYETYKQKNQKALASGKVLPRQTTSDFFFATNKEEFDFIYIDGDHTAFGVVRDITNAYQVLKVGGVLALDDYTWSLGQGPLFDPKPAIDWFSNLLGDRMETLVINGQAWYRKLK